MKTKLILALSFLTLGMQLNSALNSHTVSAAENKTQYRAITNFNNQEMKGIIATTNEEIGLIKCYEALSFNDYYTLDSFEFGGLSSSYSSSSSVVPTIEVEVDGNKVSTTDLSTSYADLVKQAKAANSETSQTPDDKEKEEETNVNQEAADEVIALIEALGDITIESKEAILEAKESFESLTYEQQKLVTNKEDLIKAIKDYNKLIEDDEEAEPIEALKEKTLFSSFLEDVKENKVTKTILIVTGTILLVLIIYGLYRLFKKIFKKCCK